MLQSRGKYGASSKSERVKPLEGGWPHLETHQRVVAQLETSSKVLDNPKLKQQQSSNCGLAQAALLYFVFRFHTFIFQSVMSL